MHYICGRCHFPCRLDNTGGPLPPLCPFGAPAEMVEFKPDAEPDPAPRAAVFTCHECSTPCHLRVEGAPPMPGQCPHPGPVKPAWEAIQPATPTEEEIEDMARRDIIRALLGTIIGALREER